RSAGASNVRWVWSPHVRPDLSGLGELYPGADEVDIVGIDGYMTSKSALDARDQTPSEVFGPTLDVVKSFAPQLPVWVSEVGCAGSGEAKARCAGRVLDYLSKTRVSAGLWSDIDVARGADWRLTPDGDNSATVREALARW